MVLFDQSFGVLCVYDFSFILRYLTRDRNRLKFSECNAFALADYRIRAVNQFSNKTVRVDSRPLTDVYGVFDN